MSGARPDLGVNSNTILKSRSYVCSCLLPVSDDKMHCKVALLEAFVKVVSRCL